MMKIFHLTHTHNFIYKTIIFIRKFKDQKYAWSIRSVKNLYSMCNKLLKNAKLSLYIRRNWNL